MGSFSKNVALFAIGFWLGCCVLFAVVVAPTVFYPDGKNNEVHAGTATRSISKDVAGGITGKILKSVYLIGYISLGTATFFLLAASFGDPKISKGPRRALVLCVLALALNGASDWYISNKMNKIRIQQVNTDSSEVVALKKAFDQWHKASEIVYGGAVLCGLGAALFLLPAAHTSKAGGKSKRS